MICAKPTKTFFYCHRCAHNPANKPPSDHIRTLEATYPQIEPVSGDCLDYQEMTDDPR